MEVTLDGAKVFFATGGQAFDREKPAVVFLHGAGMDHTVWTLQTRYLAHRGYAVLAVDLPGHGRSAGPPLAGVDTMAGWLVRLLDALELDAAALVGHSMGALVALTAAARHPERARALVLIGVAGRMPVHPDLLAAAEANDPGAFEMIVGWGHGRRAHLGGHPAPGLWLVGDGRRLLQRAKPGVLHLDLAACNAWQEGTESAAAVRCPALVILGGQDRMTPAKAGRKLAEAMRAEVVELPLAGHMTMLEAPDSTLDALVRFLRLVLPVETAA